MRCISRIALLSVVLSLTVSLPFAQGRPQCGDIVRDGACFIDDDGIWQFISHGDFDGNQIVLWWLSNDFVQVRPDGTVFGVGTDVNAEFWVCPATAGGFDCILEYLRTGVQPEGMLIGTGQFSNAGVWTQDFQFSCPNTLHAKGSVFDLSGQEFSLTDTVILLKAPGVDGCRVHTVDIAVSAAD